MAYRRIMVGTDGSETARRAEQAAARLARACQAQLLIFSAHGDPAEASGVLGRAEAEARGQGVVEVRTETQRGKPEALMIEVADQQDVDLMVVGNRGMAGRRLFKSSVPDHISHNAPCDLLIVRTTEENPESTWGDYKRMLIATDGSSTADRAVRKGMDLAGQLGARPALLYVGFPQTGENVLRDTLRRLGPGDEGAETLVRQGDPAEAIVETAGREGFDLVLVGNKGMAGSLRTRLGSVPDKVSHQATTDVLIARTATLSLDEVPPGEGAVVIEDGARLAVYVEDDGTRHVLSAKCTHLGCSVEWRAGDRSWGCPCHGSRFRFDGTVVDGPATRDLERVER